MDDTRQGNAIVRISLIILRFKCHPDGITEILGIRPSKSGLPGDPEVAPNGRLTGKKVKNAFWSLQASSDHQALFEEQLDDLLQLIKPVQDAFNQLPKDLTVAVGCTVFPEEKIPLFTLKPNAMKVMAAIGATFLLDIDQSG